MSILSYLYHRAKAKHTKLSNRLVKNLRTRRFEEYSPRKKHQVLQKLEKQRGKISRLSLQLAIATGVSLGGIAISDQAQAQNQADGLGPFQELPREKNPLHPPIQIQSDFYSRFELADIDGDGDDDLYVTGYYEGNEYLYLFENLQSDLSSPSAIFKDRQSLTFPFYGNGNVDISFIDADGDLDLDLYIGGDNFFCGPSMFFRNDGGVNGDINLSVGPGSFVYARYSYDNIFAHSDNIIGGGPAWPPLGPIGFISRETIVEVDIDGDTDLDFFVGSAYSGVKFLQNNGGLLYDIPHSFNSIGLENRQPAFIDIDGDGDQDAFISERYGAVHFFRNNDFDDNGIIDNPNTFFQEDSNPINPLYNIDFGYFPKPNVSDIDNDGDMDLVVGFSDPFNIPGKEYYHGTNFRTFINDGSFNFTEVYSLDNPFGGVDVRYDAAPNLVDVDNDGDLDAFIGSDHGKVQFFQNGSGSFSEKMGIENPLGAFDKGYNTNTKPELADTDNDGDLDAYIGVNRSGVGPYPYFYSYRNSGTPVLPLFDFPYNSSNSLFQEVQNAIISFTAKVYPTIGDIDGDGDLDALVGGIDDGGEHHHFFENLNAPPSPPPVDTPATFAGTVTLSGVFFGGNDVPEFTDLDHDGDLDIHRVSGYDIRTIENDGSQNFSELGPGNSDPSNHLYEVNSNIFGFEPVIDVVDFDGDDDLDVFIGDNNGHIRVFENTNLPVDVSLTGGSLNIIENDPATPAFSVGGIDDPDITDNTMIVEAAIKIPGFIPGEASISFVDQSGIVGDNAGTFNSTGIYKLEGSATFADYITAINASLMYQELGDNPPSSRTIELSIRDSDYTAPNVYSKTVNITAVNDPPSLTSTAGTTGTEDIAYNYTAAVTDLDDANDGVELTWSLSGEPAGMTVSSTGVVSWTPLEGVLISGAVTLSVQDGGEDGALPSSEVFTLTVTPVNDAPSITSAAGTTGDEGMLYTYTPIVVDPDDPNDGTNLTWSLSGEPTGMTVDAMGVVSWTPGAVTTSGSVTLTVQDGGEDGALPFSEVFVITVTPLVVDAPPVLSLTTNSFNYTENDGPQPIDTGISITDDGTQLTGGLITLTTNFSSGQDVLGFTNQSGITGSFDSVSGVLTLTGNATIAQYETALGFLTFRNTNEDPGVITKTIEITLDDGVNTSTAATLDVQITPVNDAPLISGSSGDLAYRSLTGTIIVDDQIALSDVDDTDLVGGIIRVASSYSAGEDILAFTDQNGITGSFNSVTGILTLSGTATVADYETALRSITYENTVPSPSAAGKPIDFQVSDAATISTAFSRTIVVASNQVIAAEADVQADVGGDVTIDVISSATFTPGDIITTTITVGPNFGTALVNPDGSILYTPSNDTANGEIDVITYELCNEYVSCGTNDINITISNTPPDVSIPLTEIEPGGVATVPLALGVSDQNGNFDPNSVIVAEQPFSGLPVTIDSDLNLIINYSGSGFQGADHIIIEVCDFSGACTQFDVVIAVGEVRKVLIYNGVTPNNDGINDVLRILDVEFFPENEMLVYNKLGRLVYNVQNYDNNSVVFSGVDNDNNKLEDGTYYYVIVLVDPVDPGGKKLRQSGYIVLQR